MFYIALIHGMMFVFLGMVAAIQAGSSVNFLPRKTTYLLSAFALSRGILKFLELSHSVGAPGSERFAAIAMALSAPSFLLLTLFGADLAAYFAPWRAQIKTRIRLVPVLCAIIWFILLRVRIIADADAFFATEVTARYAFGLPGAALAALGAYLASRSANPTVQQLRIHFFVVSVAFGIYGMLAGIVTPISFFGEPLGLPGAAVRMACTAVMAGVLSHALIIQVTRVKALLEESRDRHLAMIAHDLKNPLSAIQLNAQLLARSLPADAMPRDRELLDRLLHGVKHMQRLLGDLFDSSLVHQNHLVLNKSRTEMVILLEEVVHRNCQDRQIILDLPRSPIFSIVDPDRMEQVLGNLVSNACKYSDPGSTIRVMAKPLGNLIEISVTNEGAGIPAEEQELIFTRFYRCKSVRSTSKKGTGLGLYITKALVEAHGGHVALSSEPGKLTTFSVRLPCAS